MCLGATSFRIHKIRANGIGLILVNNYWNSRRGQFWLAALYPPNEVFWNWSKRLFKFNSDTPSTWCNNLRTRLFRLHPTHHALLTSSRIKHQIRLLLSFLWEFLRYLGVACWMNWGEWHPPRLVKTPTQNLYNINSVKKLYFALHSISAGYASVPFEKTTSNHLFIKDYFD